MDAPKPPPSPSPIGDGDSPEALARRFLDLWQEHWTATLTDPETLRSWAALFDPAHAARWLSGFGGPGEGLGDDPARPPAAAPASGRGGPELDQRDRRLAALEERVARLESALAGAAAPRRRTPRKPAG